MIAEITTIQIDGRPDVQTLALNSEFILKANTFAPGDGINSRIVYEDEKVLVFPPLGPVNEGHLLIIPKKHAPYMDDLDEETTLHIMRVARRIAAAIRKSRYRSDGISLFVADGEAAGQEVFHFHS